MSFQIIATTTAICCCILFFCIADIEVRFNCVAPAATAVVIVVVAAYFRACFKVLIDFGFSIFQTGQIALGSWSACEKKLFRLSRE